MNKKITYISILLLVIIISVGYAYFINTAPDQIPKQQAKNQTKKDKLPKTELEGVEENINAVDIKNDLKITKNLLREQSKVLTLNPSQRTQLLKNIGPKRKNCV